MLIPKGWTAESPHFEQYPLIRDSVFKPAKHFFTFLFSNSHKLLLDGVDKTEFADILRIIYHHFKNMELRSDELDSDFVSELVKWEMRTMIETENEEYCVRVFWNMLRGTCEWNRTLPERQKRRQVLLREEGGDDALDLRVVGTDYMQERSFNPNLDLMLHRLVTFHRSNFHHYCQSLSLDSTITVQIYDFYTLGAQYHSLTLQQGSSHCILLIFVVNPLSLLFY
ncbi:hypothetical protein BLNAU_14456 [Blattamonas nauphoetae]|uniref:BTB domain-containing protein n=1 Tax=Blattamonas nauphoetae TaxID=2049346 RepID=A0ABQ9XKI9_9EUKA|nr:hypothetical protein BLNAU_14456 [Blattamonas nauphoetae]